MKRQIVNVGLAGLIAGIVVACSGPAMEMAGDTLQDAGALVRDAGASIAGGGAGVLSDAGSLLADAGTVLRDAGNAMRDAGGARHAGRGMKNAGKQMMDAGRTLMDAANDADSVVHAQACGEWCSPEGAQRMITADQDSTRYVRRQYLDADWHKEVVSAAGYSYYAYSIEVRRGPFMLQRLSYVENLEGEVYLVPSSISCLRGFSGNQVDLPAERTVLSAPADLPLMLQADERLCAYGYFAVSDANPAPAGGEITVRGYEPYE